MDKRIIKIEECKFRQNKRPILINDIDINPNLGGLLWGSFWVGRRG